MSRIPARLRTVAVLVGLALFAAVGCQGRRATSLSRQDSPLRWVSCQGSFQCATLAVPLDHAHPTGRQITLALIRTLATDRAHRIGSLLVNPGGPGESALSEWSFLSGQVSTQLHQRFDVVGFDPRGVGQSTPVHCTDSAGLDAFVALDFAPTSAAQSQAVVDGARRIAADCARQAGDLLPYVGTADAARDLDDIRRAVGDSALSYLGFSYGTYLGAQYADEYPGRVRALVLDGALDPTLAPLRSIDVQSRGFQRQIDRFLAACAAASNCPWHPTTALPAALHDLLTRIAQQPLPTHLATRLLHQGEAFYGLAVALYSPTSWPDLQLALAQADAGDGTALLSLSDAYTQRSSAGGYSNTLEANLAVSCRDAAWPTDPSTYLAAARASEAFAPDFGADNIDTSLPCAFWPVRASGPQPPLRAVGAAPILVVASTGDPATPYSDGVALARQLTSGVLLTRVGEGHTAYGASTCIQRLVDSYLIDRSVPAVGTRCSP